MTGHGRFGVNDDGDVPFLAQIFIGIGADEGNFEIGLADFEFIADLNISGELGDGMLDDHISESGSDFLVHEDKAGIALQVGWGVLADARHGDFVLNHLNTSLGRIIAGDSENCNRF